MLETILVFVAGGVAVLVVQKAIDKARHIFR